jgi:hypothetical protein
MKLTKAQRQAMIDRNALIDALRAGKSISDLDARLTTVYFTSTECITKDSQKCEVK